MKPSIFLLTLAAGAFAQTAPSTTQRIPSVAVEEHAGVATSQLSRIDLDFKGGPPAALVEAISKSVGKQVNVIIDEGDSQVRLPPIHVRNATIADIFSALTSATAREVNIPTGRDSYQIGQVRSQFLANNSSTITDETVWSFVSNEPETQQRQLSSAKVPKPALRHFQLGSWLNDNLTVEDITTTIRTGWELLGIKEQPALKFHKETGILIAAGDAELLDQIPMVLQQLPTQDRLGSLTPPPIPSNPRVNQLRQSVPPAPVSPLK